VTGAIDCFAGGDAVIRPFHMKRLSPIDRDRIMPAVNVSDYFHARPIDRQYLGNAFE
jgi:hypothetical protein